MHPHFSRNMSQDPMAIRQFDTKHGIGKSLNNRALNFYDIFFSHVSNSLPDAILNYPKKQAIILHVSPIVNTPLAFRQNIRFIFRDCNRMLKMG